jgi:hypothetical protein
VRPARPTRAAHQDGSASDSAHRLQLHAPVLELTTFRQRSRRREAEVLSVLAGHLVGAVFRNGPGAFIAVSETTLPTPPYWCAPAATCTTRSAHPGWAWGRLRGNPSRATDASSATAPTKTKLPHDIRPAEGLASSGANLTRVPSEFQTLFDNRDEIPSFLPTYRAETGSSQWLMPRRQEWETECFLR